MNKKITIFLSLLLIIILFSSCAHTIDVSSCTQYMEIYGFWGGLWHGIISPFTFIGSLFSHDITIYAVNNNGNWYNFGFVLGAGILGGGIFRSSN